MQLEPTRPSKSQNGIPEPGTPRGVDWKSEARRSRRKLTPSSLVYGVAGFVLLTPEMNDSAWEGPAFVLALLAFTGIEYAVHRFLLHGRFPNGPGRVRRFLHRRLDHLHYIHHLRPWDGAHMNGSLRDTLPLTVPLVIAALAAPPPTAAFVGTLLLAYLAEEWTHHSLHYGRSKNRILVRLRRRHHVHHSPRGKDRVYGLTSGVWDFALGTGRLSSSSRSRAESTC